MEPPVHQQRPGPRPRPTSGLLAGVVQLISSVESAIFKLKPCNLDPNFTGRRFTWRKGEVKGRRMPESRVAVYLYGQQSWIIGVLLPSSKDLPTVRTEPILQWWRPRERNLQILFSLIENLSARWHSSVFISANPTEKAVTLCFIIVKAVISIPNQHTSPWMSMGTASRDISQLRKSVSTLRQLSLLYFFTSLKTKVSHPPPRVLFGGGSKQYFMVIGHIYTSNWYTCQPWYVGWSIKPCQRGVMPVLSLLAVFICKMN